MTNLILGLIGGAFAGVIAGTLIIAPAIDTRPIEVTVKQAEPQYITQAGDKFGCLPVVRAK